MRLKRSMFPVFLIVVFAIFSCNDKNDSIKKDLAGSWKMMGMGGVGAARIPDSIKQLMYGTRFMQFTEGGEMIATSEGVPEQQHGNFTIDDDGKTLITSRNGRASDTMVINKLTKDTLILLIKGANIEVTWIPK